MTLFIAHQEDMQCTDLKMLMLMWIKVVLFTIVDSRTQKIIVHQPTPVISAAPGDNVTLRCFLSEDQGNDPIVWYKQPGGHEPSLVAVVQKIQDPIYEDKFDSQRFRIEKGNSSFHLKITNVNPSDEAVYYCGVIPFYTVFAKGTFLSVKGNEDVKVSVTQRGVSDPVPAGTPETLQCSVLSKRIASEVQMLWFRAAPPQSHPQIIYTHTHNSHQDSSSFNTQTCVYNFTKNILNLNDTRTYYCAVTLCGKIVFENRTPEQDDGHDEAFNPVVISLGTVLVMCWILISGQTVLLIKRRNSQQCRERSHHGSEETQTGDVVELNYAALQFNEKKGKKERGNRGRSQDSVYSKVKYSTISH